MKHYYLLGSPIRHSLSPAMMNLSFRNLGIDAEYSLCETDEAHLPGTVDRLLETGASGWNVTMPCKSAMASLCDTLSDAARIAGAVNTVVVKSGTLEGHTTDGTGFMNAAASSGFPLPGRKITLLGTGGAASSILIQAALDGVSSVSVFYHRPSSAERIRQIAEQLSGLTGTLISLFPLDDSERLKTELLDSTACVNATNVGMNDTGAEGPSCLIPDRSYLPRRLFVYDIIYHPAVTPLLVMAEQCGCPWANGESMLVMQGAESFRLWTGRTMPLGEVMKLFHGQ